MKLLIEDRFPTMVARTTHGDMTLPDEYAGHWFVFFSHPGDFTPVCTTEFVAFQKRSESFAALNTKLVGLSVDDVDDHRAWVTWIQDNLQVGVEFPIIDDKDRSISTQLGMLRPDQTGSVTARSVIVVDDRGDRPHDPRVSPRSSAATSTRSFGSSKASSCSTPPT